MSVNILRSATGADGTRIVVNENNYAKGLATPVRYVKGVGERRAEQLARLDIHTVGDLLYTLPRRYEDRTQFTRISQLQSGDFATISCAVKACDWVKSRYGKPYFEAMVSDGSGIAHCRWYNAHYLKEQLKVETALVIFGKVSKSRGRISFQHPDFEVGEKGDEESLHMGRVVPIYALTENLQQRSARRIMWNAVNAFIGEVREILPESLLDRLGLLPAQEALSTVHFPETLARARAARYRLVFEEFLCVQLVLVARKIHSEQVLVGTAHNIVGRLKDSFVDSLPFELTGAQKRVIEEIENDMRKPRPMHRLLQGDVGSGKTVVAASALLDAIECECQGTVMTPTEILARQHYVSFKEYLEPLGLRVLLLTSDLSAARRKEVLPRIKDGWYHLVVGTHALIEDRVQFKKLGLAVIDEQHKFGVEQRGELYGKAHNPDVLVMTATPIPRTLAMTLYGDLDVSIVDEMPTGRKETVTRVIKEDQLPDAYGFIRKQVAKGRQAYIVYPLVSESDKLELKSAEEMFRHLRGEVFHDESVGLLHGQMPSGEKAAVMDLFKNGELDILVATTVIEVGVDVPNATVMLIENAERFGLAQLHQLRGRIGRGAHKSFCVLQGSPTTLDSWKRLKVMEKTTDGFVIAEEDMKIRGMGNLLGREQSGFPALRVGDPLGDSDILLDARREAFTIVESDPKMTKPEFEGLRSRARALYKLVGPFVRVG
ncbi:MAG: ATP-dependent DNA helicase RecG [Verrucomicrobia bacterium]|nr:ATP-dependent DNA helicase RecG [Verrucomicrobiota bacterium]